MAQQAAPLRHDKLTFFFAGAITQSSIMIMLNPLITLVLSRILDAFHVSWATAMPADTIAYFGAVMGLFGAGMVVLRQNKLE